MRRQMNGQLAERTVRVTSVGTRRPLRAAWPALLLTALTLGCLARPASADSHAAAQTFRLLLATEHTSGAEVQRIGRIVVSRRGARACRRRCSLTLARGDEVILRARP